ncbi:MAG: MMPL family transporter, partial [Thermodesulfobacteriota bacterium]
DLRPLLPSGASKAGEDFRLLQKAPFMQKVVLTLEAGPKVETGKLTATADALAAALKGPFYSRVVSGPRMDTADDFFAFLLDAAPALMTDEDLEKIREGLSGEGIASRFKEMLSKLDSTEGWVMKTLLQEDPLGFLGVITDKLRRMNLFQGLVLKGRHFVSVDGRKALLAADTPISITDSSGSKQLVDYTQRTIDRLTSPGIRVSFISGHVYTQANAESIKKDLYLILSSVAVTILALLFIFMRSWRAIFVFLVPSSVILVATAGVLSVYQGISAITLAFGSVLLGIADDYPIFTFFSLRNQGRFSGGAVAGISRPVLFSGLTTLAAFSALFFSDLPGQRQIALFSLFGILASLAFSLLVLPHFLQGVSPAKGTFTPLTPGKRKRSRRLVIVGLWGLVMIFCLWQGTRLVFNGDMRAVNKVPAALRQTEETFKNNWGDFRGKAMVFIEGRDLESVLLRNDRLFKYMKGKMPQDHMISLAPILPSMATQQKNIRDWKAFWERKTQDQVRRLLIQEGDKAGFSAQAFVPFFKRWEAEPKPVTKEGLEKAGLGDLLESLLQSEEGRVRVLTLVPDTREVAAWLSDDRLLPFQARFISQTGFNQTISRAMHRNFYRYILTAFLFVVILLLVLFRTLSKVVYSLIPAVSGLLVMFGLMGWRGIDFNLFNIMATILVIGLSVDLGIFMVSRISEGQEAHTGQAVLLSGLTSLIGMGALTLADHPALFSMGITVLLGMCGTIPAALWVIPAFFQPKGEVKSG